MELKVGLTTKSGYLLTEKINTFEEFWDYLNKGKIIFARHKVYPTAFFFHWKLNLIHNWILSGRFYKVIKLEKRK